MVLAITEALPSEAVERLRAADGILSVAVAGR
jgi:hypothetical protein